MSQSSTIDTVFDVIDARADAFVERLIDYVRMPSISAHGIGIAEVANFLEAQLTELGMDVRQMETAGWPMVVGRRHNAPGKPTVLLYGHYDVQPPDPLDEWVSPPFEPEIRDGRIWGRGVGDNKGQHFAQILAIESMLTCLPELPCNVTMLLEGEEEVGSPHIAAFVRGQREFLRSDLVITADGPVHNSGRPTLMLGVRGVISFELHARGANQDLHTGNWGGVAPNPIWALVHALGTMKNAAGEITIDGFYDSIDSASALERQALDALPVDEAAIMQQLDLRAFDAPHDRAYYDRLSLWPTFTINGFHGGYGGPGSKTVLPHKAFVKCDMRLIESQTVDEIAQKLADHLHKHAPDVELKLQGGMDPSRTPLDSVYAGPIREAIEVAQGETPVLIPAMGGSLPDYVFTKILGVPAFNTPYANADESNHAPNENLEVRRFINGVKTGAAVLDRLGRL